MKHNNSEKIFKTAQEKMPGGVNSPVRAFQNVGVNPPFIKRADKAYVYDEDDNKYLDFISSWGPMILGHNHPLLRDSLNEASKLGLSYGLPTKIEVELADLMIDAYPGLEMVRMVNSGTEATMSAIRVARGATNRDKIIKFEGNYHGHNDSLLVSSGSGMLTYNVPTSPGVPNDIIKNTLVCEYNNLISVEKCIEKYPDEIAAIIVEPIAGNMGLVKGSDEFLSGLRKLCDENGILLIFDEVISGFRASYQGSTAINHITPDLACFGKIIGGGMPIGAYGGKKAIMEQVAPAGPIYQAGTLSGNPLAMHVGKTMLTYLRDHPEVYDDLETKGAYLVENLETIIEEFGLPIQINRCGSLMTIFFNDKAVNYFKDVQNCDFKAYEQFFKLMYERNILLPPSQYECLFLNIMHTKDDLDYFIKAFKESVMEIYHVS